MTCQLLPWLLATVLGTVSGEIGDGPDDPYLWLEEVPGEKPMAWVKERNAESTAELTRSDRFRALEHRLLEILDSDARIPDIQKVGPFYYNFWRDAKNPRGLWRRTTLEEYRKDKPDWEVVIDLDELAGRSRRTGSGTGPRCSGPGTSGPDLALARRGRRGRRPRVRPGEEGLHQGRLHPPRGQEPDRLARRRQRLRRHRLRPGLADRFGLPAGRQGMEAGDAAGRGRPSSSRAGPRTWASAPTAT